MSREYRRGALKALAMSAHVVWVQPIVNSIVLPAHAQLSVVPDCSNIIIAMSTMTTSVNLPGGMVDVTISVTNNSSQPLDVSDSNQISFSSGSPSGWQNGAPGNNFVVLVQSIGVVQPGQTEQVTHTGTIVSAADCGALNPNNVTWRLTATIPIDGTTCPDVFLNVPCTTG